MGPSFKWAPYCGKAASGQWSVVSPHNNHSKDAPKNLDVSVLEEPINVDPAIWFQDDRLVSIELQPHSLVAVRVVRLHFHAAGNRFFGVREKIAPAL